METIDQIIKELKQQNYTHFDDFYHLTKKQVFFSIRAIIKDEQLSEDLLQDTYMRFLERIDQYRNGANPYAYLVTIGRRLAIDTYHQRKKEVISEELINHQVYEEEVHEENNDLFKLLDKLSKDEREVVVLHVINDLKFRDVADIMDRPLGTVLWIYQKAMKKLKREVGEESD